MTVPLEVVVTVAQPGRPTLLTRARAVFGDVNEPKVNVVCVPTGNVASFSILIRVFDFLGLTSTG